MAALSEDGDLAASPDAASFILAAQSGDVEKISRILRNDDTRPNEWTDDLHRCSALHWASACDEPAVVQVLLNDPRVSPSLQSRHGSTAMHHAAAANALRALRELLSSSRCEGLIDQANRWGETALHLAAAAGSTAAVDMLIQAGADTGIQDAWGRTCARVAIEQGAQCSLPPSACDKEAGDYTILGAPCIDAASTSQAAALTALRTELQQAHARPCKCFPLNCRTCVECCI
eukprot:6186415-Pleurochrysis_carterae.AAC.3